jgi:hypothetical protein
MFQVIAKRDDKVGYQILQSDVPEELSKDSIVYMPELSTKQLPHIKYGSKYTHTTGHIIVKLVRSDGLDPFGRPKSLSHSLVIPSEEYNSNSLLYYTSPLFMTQLFDEAESEQELLSQNIFRPSENKILEKVDISLLREIIVAAMTEQKVTILPDLETRGIYELSSLIDKSIPFEASYDFSLISYSDKSCNKFLVHNIVYFFGKDQKIKSGISLRNVDSKVRKIAKEESDYLDNFIELIIKEDYEEILEEHAKWVIGIYHSDHKDLHKMFTKRYQLDMPFSRRNKFHAKLVQSLSSSEKN